MKVLIITDDTGVKLPSHNKWKNKYSRGIDIRKDSNIKSRLNEYKIKFPGNDIENETQFKKVLHDFVRPAKQMYGGMFNEVRTFAQDLSSFISTKTYFISGRYGIISENKEIIPYYFEISTLEVLELCDKKFDIIEKIHRLIDKNEIVLFLLPKQYIAYLIKIGFFYDNMINSIFIIVSSKEYRDYFSQIPNVLLLHRIGVARIGKKNRQRIVEYINEIRKTRGKRNN